MRGSRRKSGRNPFFRNLTGNLLDAPLYVELISRYHDAAVVLDVGDHQRKMELNKLPTFLLFVVFIYLESPLKAAGVFTSLSKEIQIGCVTNRRRELFLWMYRENNKGQAENISYNIMLRENNPVVFNPDTVDEAAQSAWYKENFPRLSYAQTHHLDRALIVVLCLFMVIAFELAHDFINNDEFLVCMDQLWKEGCNKTLGSYSLFCNEGNFRTIIWDEDVIDRYRVKTQTPLSWRDEKFFRREQKFDSSCMLYATRPLDSTVQGFLSLFFVLVATLTVVSGCSGDTIATSGPLPHCNAYRQRTIRRFMNRRWKREWLRDERLRMPANWLTVMTETTRTGETKQESDFGTLSGFGIV